VKDSAEKSETRYAQTTDFFLSLRLPPSRTFTRLGLSQEASLPLRIADTDNYIITVLSVLTGSVGNHKMRSSEAGAALIFWLLFHQGKCKFNYF